LFSSLISVSIHCSKSHSGGGVCKKHNYHNHNIAHNTHMISYEKKTKLLPSNQYGSDEVWDRTYICQTSNTSGYRFVLHRTWLPCKHHRRKTLTPKHH
jgi:hypothetical protein